MAPGGLAKLVEMAGIEEMDKDSSSTGLVRANEKLLVDRRWPETAPQRPPIQYLEI